MKIFLKKKWYVKNTWHDWKILIQGLSYIFRQLAESFLKAQVIWSRKINSDVGSGHWLSTPADQRSPTCLFRRAMLGNSTSCGKERAQEKQTTISRLFSSNLGCNLVSNCNWYSVQSDLKPDSDC